jgi:hypothetical protein
MAGIRIEGSVTGNVAEVDSNNNQKVVLPIVAAQAGYAGLVTVNDEGTVSGSRYTKRLRASEDSRLQVGMDTAMFDYSFNAVAQNTAIWKFQQATTTMAMTQGTGFLTLNSGSVLTANAAVGLQTWRCFTLRGNAAMHIEITGLITVAPLANQVFEAGLFFTSATGAAPVAPTDGVYFRLTSAGLVGILNYNNVETPTGILMAAGSIPLNTNAIYKMVVSEAAVEFWANDIFLGEIATPAGNGAPFMSGALPLCFQARNTGAVSGTPMLVKITDCHIDQMDMQEYVPYTHQQAGMGLQGSQAQDGATMGSTALFGNSLAAGAGAVMTNTTAALGTGLGGQFTALPSLAAGTDGIVCSYQVPQGTVNITPRTLVITGVRVQGIVTAAITGGPCAFVYSLAYGHTALSMATGEGTTFGTSPTTKAPRRLPIGGEGIIVTAPVGTLGSQNGASIVFQTPVVVNPGEFVAICAKNLGVVTSVGTVTFIVSFDSYWI